MNEDKNTNKFIIILIIIILILLAVFGIKIFSKKTSEKAYNEIATDYNELEESLSGIGANLLNPTELTEEGLISNINEYNETVWNSSLMQKLFHNLTQFFIVFLIIVVIYYICIGIGLQKIAKAEGYSGWQAWLPIFNIYLLYKIGFKDSKIKWAVLAVFLTGTGTLALPTILQIVVELLLIGLMLISLYNIFSEKSDKALYMIVMCIIASVISYFCGLSLGGIVSSFGVLGPFLLLAVKNK